MVPNPVPNNLTGIEVLFFDINFFDIKFDVAVFDVPVFSMLPFRCPHFFFDVLGFDIPSFPAGTSLHAMIIQVSHDRHSGIGRILYHSIKNLIS